MLFDKYDTIPNWKQNNAGSQQESSVSPNQRFPTAKILKYNSKACIWPNKPNNQQAKQLRVIRYVDIHVKGPLKFKCFNHLCPTQCHLYFFPFLCASKIYILSIPYLRGLWSLNILSFTANQDAHVISSLT